MAADHPARLPFAINQNDIAAMQDDRAILFARPRSRASYAINWRLCAAPGRSLHERFRGGADLPAHDLPIFVFLRKMAAQ